MSLRSAADKIALDAVARIWRRRGLTAKIARHLKVPHQTVAGWKRVPPHHMFCVAVLSGIRVIELRPDLFLNDPLRANLTKLYVLRYQPEPRTPRLGKVHEAIWLDVEHYATNDAAAKAVSALVGRKVNRAHLQYRFGASGRAFHKFGPGYGYRLLPTPQNQPFAAHEAQSGM